MPIFLMISSPFRLLHFGLMGLLSVDFHWWFSSAVVSFRCCRNIFLHAASRDWFSDFLLIDFSAFSLWFSGIDVLIFIISFLIIASSISRCHFDAPFSLISDAGGALFLFWLFSLWFFSWIDVDFSGLLWFIFHFFDLLIFAEVTLDFLPYFHLILLIDADVLIDFDCSLRKYFAFDAATKLSLFRLITFCVSMPVRGFFDFSISLPVNIFADIFARRRLIRAIFYFSSPWYCDAFVISFRFQPGRHFRWCWSMLSLRFYYVFSLPMMGWISISIFRCRCRHFDFRFHRRLMPFLLH